MARGYDDEEVKNVGDDVDPSVPLLKVHTSSKEIFEKYKEEIKQCFVLSDQKSLPLKEIYQIL